MARRADHDLKREVFAAAALRVIMRAGVGGLTVREVAKEAGFTTGALTHYFQSKDQVLIEASEYSARLVRPRMEKKARASDALGALKGVVDEALPITAAVRGYWRIWFGFWERAAYNPAVAKVMRARYDEWRGRLAVLIRRAQGEGLAPSDVDADLASQELVALVDGIAIQVLLGTGRISAARQREIIGAWIGLLAGGHVGRAGRPLGADPASRAVG
ncbi:MAG TPA: TetR family transcriptional regulator C-terminal domain-containing protein [Caulobacteraceae bacterium]|jgi:AcrR family transcriptional regulator|nr:TetR family transcriptional regulator C-terminal domain-containing protein [Caulobacteraceae bacterium]